MPRSKNKIVQRLLKAKPSEIPAWAISLAQLKHAKKIGDIQGLCSQLENDSERVIAIRHALLDVMPVHHKPSTIHYLL